MSRISTSEDFSSLPYSSSSYIPSSSSCILCQTLSSTQSSDDIIMDRPPARMRRLFGIVIIWIISSAILILIWSIAPSIQSNHKLAFPTNIEDLVELAKLLIQYRDAHFTYTVILFSAAYLYKQTFAIPGSFFLNLLAGALFGVWLGCLLVSSLTAIGASLCFILSALFARPIIDRCFSSKLNALRRKLSTERHRLFLFLLSARVFPFTPHWMLNISSPFLDIPLWTHTSTVALGLLPYNILCVRAGRVLSDVHSFWSVFDLWTLLELLFLASLLFLAGRFIRRRRNDDPPTEVHVSSD